MDYDQKAASRASPVPRKYEIRRDGITYAQWDCPSCSPDKDTLKAMKQAGYRLYIDGKLQR